MVRSKAYDLTRQQMVEALGLASRAALTDSLLLGEAGSVGAISDRFFSFYGSFPPAQWFAAGRCLRAAIWTGSAQTFSSPLPGQNLCSSVTSSVIDSPPRRLDVWIPIYKLEGLWSERESANRPNSSFGPAVGHCTQRRGLSTGGVAP